MLEVIAYCLVMMDNPFHARYTESEWACTLAVFSRRDDFFQAVWSVWDIVVTGEPTNPSPLCKKYMHAAGLCAGKIANIGRTKTYVAFSID